MIAARRTFQGVFKAALSLQKSKGGRSPRERCHLGVESVFGLQASFPRQKSAALTLTNLQANSSSYSPSSSSLRSLHTNIPVFVPSKFTSVWWFSEQPGLLWCRSVVRQSSQARWLPGTLPRFDERQHPESRKRWLKFISKLSIWYGAADNAAEFISHPENLLFIRTLMLICSLPAAAENIHNKQTCWRVLLFCEQHSSSETSSIIPHSCYRLFISETSGWFGKTEIDTTERLQQHELLQKKKQGKIVFIWETREKSDCKTQTGEKIQLFIYGNRRQQRETELSVCALCSFHQCFCTFP